MEKLREAKLAELRWRRIMAWCMRNGCGVLAIKASTEYRMRMAQIAIDHGQRHSAADVEAAA